VIVISHNLNDVFQVADNIAAMYLGTMAAQVEKNSVSQNDVVRLITTGSADAVSGAKK
jgi:D-xylose transport system ATP-binding protein